MRVATVLSLAGVGRNDSFFELGGDSITAIRTVSLLRKAGYHCSVSRVMQSMTVDEIARHIDVAAPAAAPVRHLHGPVGRLPMVDEFLAWGLAEPAHFNQDAVVDLGRFDWDALPGLMAEAEKRLGVEKPENRYLIVDPASPFHDKQPVLRLYLSDEYGGGYLTADVDGKVIDVSPRS